MNVRLQLGEEGGKMSHSVLQAAFVEVAFVTRTKVQIALALHRNPPPSCGERLEFTGSRRLRRSAVLILRSGRQGGLEESSLLYPSRGETPSAFKVEEEEEGVVQGVLLWLW